MVFKYQTARLTYDKKTKEYIHPVTGERTTSVLKCLAGWAEPDPFKRRNWGMLVKNIQEFWEAPESSNQIAEAEEIDFS
jgi:hypothetical protein